MDPLSLIQKLSDCLDSYKVISVHLVWIDGSHETLLLEPYLIGDNTDSQWTFIYGRIHATHQLVYLPCAYIVSFELTPDDFTVEEQNKTYYIRNNEKNNVLKTLSGLLVEDLSDPDEDEDEDEDEDGEEESRPECPYCDAEEECEHLVFHYDLSEGECIFEHSDFSSMTPFLEKVFSELITGNKNYQPTEIKRHGLNNEHFYLKELWDEAVLSYDKRKKNGRYQLQYFYVVYQVPFCIRPFGF